MSLYICTALYQDQHHSEILLIKMSHHNFLNKADRLKMESDEDRWNFGELILLAPII